MIVFTPTGSLNTPLRCLPWETLPWLIWGSYSKSSRNHPWGDSRQMSRLQVIQTLLDNVHMFYFLHVCVMCVCLFMCVCMCLCLWVCIHLCVWRPKADTGCLSRLLPLYLARQGLAEPRTHRFPVSPPKCWEDEWISMLAWRLWLFCGLWDLNTGPHIYTASALSTRSSSQPVLNFLMFICLYYMLYIICCSVYIM